MKSTFTFAFTCALVLSLASFANSATISLHSFTGFTLAPTVVAPNVTASSISTFGTTSTTGSGLITDGAVTPSGDPQFSETGFDDGGYFSFTVQADSGYQLSLTDFEFYQRLGSTGASRTFSAEYIINGGTPVVFASGTANTTTYTLRSGALSIVDVAEPIEFRINGLIANVLTTFRIDDLELRGSVSMLPVPEPSSGILLAGCTLFFFARRRRGMKK